MWVLLFWQMSLCCSLPRTGPTWALALARSRHHVCARLPYPPPGLKCARKPRRKSATATLCHSSFQMLAHLPANEGIRQCGLAGLLLGSLTLASSVPAQAPQLASQWGESAPAAAAHPRPEPHIHHDLGVVARQSLRLDRWTCVQLSVTCGQCNTDDRPVVLEECLRVLSSRPECCGSGCVGPRQTIPKS